MNNNKSLLHFSKHLFLVSNVYVQRHKSKEDVNNYLQKMRKSIIRLRLTYSDVDILKEKIENLINLEREYAKFFKPEDKKTKELRDRINHLEQELKNDKEEKQKIIFENDEKIKQLTDSLDNVKSSMRSLLMERARRQQRLNALERKIRHKIDVRGYYDS